MDKRVGVLGGGQLGLMLAESAVSLGVKTVILDAHNAPAKQISVGHVKHIVGSFKEADDVRQLARSSDILTVEIEHVDVPVLHELAATGKEIHPDPSTIEVIQDKYAQKQYYESHGIATPKSLPIDISSDNYSNVDKAARELGNYPIMLKARRNAYDGRGNAKVSSSDGLQAALSTLGDQELYAEQWCTFKMELAVMVVKIQSEPDTTEWKANTLAFPVVETVHQDSICKLTFCPPRHVDDDLREKASHLARKAVAGFKGKGIYGVEMFLLSNDELLVNEIAPRPHNSGHYTIDACRMSQFEAHLRSILSWPIPEESLATHSPSIMLNILGGAAGSSHLELVRASYPVPGAHVHLYGKGDGRPGRKMGHITVAGSSFDEVEKRINPLINVFDRIREAVKSSASAPGGSPAQVRAVQPHQALRTKQAAKGVAKVLVTMGSKSDLPKLIAGIKLLDELRIPRFVTITSAHRTPERMAECARNAEGDGFQVIIAAAGGAAHLPGMMASETTLPVIGIPVKSEGSDASPAIDSILHMPRGCPVATVAPNNSINAALLAARIIARQNLEVRARLIEYHQRQTREVIRDAEVLEDIDFDSFLCQQGLA